jgi:hypothetical protein
MTTGLDTRHETERDLVSWMGPVLVHSVAPDIWRQIKNDIEAQTYTIEFEVRNYNGHLYFSIGVVDAGGYKTDWNGGLHGS